MTVQWKLPAWVHQLKFLDDRMQLFHQQCRPSCPILVVDQPIRATLRFLKHGLMMPVRRRRGHLLRSRPRKGASVRRLSSMVLPHDFRERWPALEEEGDCNRKTREHTERCHDSSDN